MYTMFNCTQEVYDLLFYFDLEKITVKRLL